MGEILKNKYVVGLLATVIVYFFFIRPMFNKDETNYNWEEIKNDDSYDPSQTTLTNEEALRIANSMYEEMNGLNLLPNVEFWYEIYKSVPTRNDAIKVIRAFGTRKGQTLIQWLNNEYSLNFTNRAGKWIKEKFAIYSTPS